MPFFGTAIKFLTLLYIQLINSSTINKHLNLQFNNQDIIGVTKKTGSFVESIRCHANEVEVELKTKLPPLSTNGNQSWILEVENNPSCPAVTKNQVEPGHRITILYADKQLCGIEPVSLITPNWISYAQTSLILHDGNGTKMRNSVICVYNTRFDSSLLTFKGDVMSENLRQGQKLNDFEMESGDVEEGAADVETVVDASHAVTMDFLDSTTGSPLNPERRIKLGDLLTFKIDVLKSSQITKILPETCYFSSSNSQDEKPAFGQTLTFIKKGCFNYRNRLVTSFLEIMERNKNGTTYRLTFPAFYFTDYGKDLYVHCTILACVGEQKLCDPDENCFSGTKRRRRRRRSVVINGRRLKSRAAKLSQIQMISHVTVDGENHQSINDNASISTPKSPIRWSSPQTSTSSIIISTSTNEHKSETEMQEFMRLSFTLFVYTLIGIVLSLIFTVIMYIYHGLKPPLLRITATRCDPVAFSCD